MALSDCLKLNKSIQFIDLSNNKLNYECAKPIAQALRQNSTLKSLNVIFIFC